jgi:Mce-associated membrane protein
MSSQSPRPPRRRIAGERRSPRPDETGGQAPDETTNEPVDLTKTPRTAERAGPPPPAGASAPAGPEAAPSRGTGPSWPAVAALGALALLLVAAAVVLGLVKWSYPEVREQDRVEAATRMAPAAAERASTAILSYDYQSLAADEKAAERYMTSSYKKKYADTFNRLVRPNAAKVKAKVEAEVKASGVAHADSDRVNVLIYVNQTTSSTANGGQPQVALNRVQLSMVRQGDRWLVNNITSY